MSDGDLREEVLLKNMEFSKTETKLSSVALLPWKPVKFSFLLGVSVA